MIDKSLIRRITFYCIGRGALDAFDRELKRQSIRDFKNYTFLARLKKRKL